FLTLWHKAGSLQEDTSLGAYLHTLVRNRVLNELAKEKVKTGHLESFTRFAERKSETADKAYLEEELAREIDKEVAKMPLRMREVYELSRKQHLSHEEISKQLSISPLTVKRQINKVLRRLRHYFSE